ncbi:hypothetical protein BH23PAT1_BH23PAT1_2270 [soil metagenome]
MRSMLLTFRIMAIINLLFLAIMFFILAMFMYAGFGGEYIVAGRSYNLLGLVSIVMIYALISRRKAPRTLLVSIIVYMILLFAGTLTASYDNVKNDPTLIGRPSYSIMDEWGSSGPLLFSVPTHVLITSLLLIPIPFITAARKHKE